MMPDSIKQARVETGDDRRPLRRDPRAEPESILPEGVEKREPSAQRFDATGIGPHSRSLPSVRTPPESSTRTAVAVRIEPISVVEDPSAVSARRPVEGAPSFDVAGASGIAALRRQLATLQLQLSDAQSQLAREQDGRAADAEEVARVLSLLSKAEADNHALGEELRREQTFVEELRVSVREKYEDCNVLRGQLADAQSLVAKELEEAANRGALVERAERAEHEGAELKVRLETLRASDESARAEVATISSQLRELQATHEALQAELAKSNATLKNANMKAYAANKQLESWKSESQRTMEQTRIEQEAALAKMAAEHSMAADALRLRAEEAGATALGLEKQMAGAMEKLSLVAKALDSIGEAERQAHGLREQAKVARRSALEQTALVRRLLSPGMPGLVTKPPQPIEPGAKKGSDPPALEIGEIEMGADDLVMELMESRRREGL
jgi:hypothetical protein